MKLSNSKLIEQSLEHAGIQIGLKSMRTISTDGNQEVIEVLLTDDRCVVAKIDEQASHDRLKKEAVGLMALRETGILVVPESHPPCVVEDRSILVMNAFQVVDCAVDNGVWERFGRDLAKHHQHKQETRYGWEHDNYIGRTVQPNTWCSSWVEFNAQYRLGYQVKMAEDRGLLDDSESAIVHRVIDLLADFIPENPIPSLLHGDLWSGNILAVRCVDTVKIAVIDPAVYIGDGLADIAMMKLFGGFPEVCFNAYIDEMDSCEDMEKRILVYQLYHMLNHLNLFGLGYATSVMRIAGQLV